MNWLLKVGMAVVAAGFAAAPNSLMAAEKNATPKDKAAAAIESISHDTGGWFPFEFPLDDVNLDGIDLTELLDAPAGKHGFVTVKPDGHFYFEDGVRARFFGTDVGGKSCAPAKDMAKVVAARLAKYGVNMLRLHAFDASYGPMIDSRAANSQSLNADALDRMDYFISELKKCGIYVYMDLLDYRQFRTADGVAHADEFTHNWQGSMKGASIFDERMIELQKDYATRLLTHRNAYTGLRYAEEPAIAVVETTNENSIFYFYRMSGLSLPYYRDELTRRWNAWLIDRYGGREKLAAAWNALTPEEDPAKGTVQLPFGMADKMRPIEPGRAGDPLLAQTRVSDMLRFFEGIQRHYTSTMHGHLKRIGVRMPVTGTNQHFFMVDTRVEASIDDFLSRNQYWRHPNVNAKPYFKFSNEAMIHVDIPTERNPLSDIASTTVAGKPQTVAEFNFPWPNEYRAEGLLMSAAYACLQDWDAFLLFSYEPDDKKLSMFRCQSDPTRWGEYPAAAMMFHRHDVARGKNEVHVVHTPKDTYTPRPDGRYARYDAFRFLTFVTKVRNVFVDDAYRGDGDVVLACGDSAEAKVDGNAKVIRLPERPWEQWLFPRFVDAGRKLGVVGFEKMDGGGKRLDSDTGELSLDYGRGLLTINSERTKSAIGFLKSAGALDLGGMSVRCDTDFAAITATSLDGQPLGRSRRMLLTSVARAENTGETYAPPAGKERGSVTGWMLPSGGRLPVLAEPVHADVRLAVPAPATVYALDGSGKRLGTVRAESDGGELHLDPAAAKSIWCEIVVK